MKIAVVGDIGVDFYENLNLTKPGGIAFNFVYSLKQNKNSEGSLVSILGNEEYSQKLLKLIKNLGINSNYIQKTAGKPPKQIIFLKNGERKFTGYDPGVLKKWKLREKDLEFIKKHDAVFVPLSDGIEHIFEKIKKLKNIIKVTDFSQDYEFTDFDKKENVITKNTKFFDLIFVGGKKKHLGMIKKLAKKYPEKVFVLTLGDQGSVAFNQGKKYLEKAKKVKVIDTTGAGDAFQAGFLATWIKTKNVKKSLYKGAIGASSIIKHVGSTQLNIK